MSGLLVSLQGAVAQGVLWGIMVLGVYITFRLMDIADMTVDGSFALGACVCAVLVVNKGVNPVLALLVAAAAGVVAGAVTGILHTVFEIPAILAGILTQISHRFFSRVCQEIGIELGGEREYGIGMFFFPQDEFKRNQAKKMFEIITQKEGLELLGWREVPTNPDVLGSKAIACMPSIWQCFIKKPARIAKGLDFDRRLYVVRRVFEQSNDNTYVASLSSRTIVYKGMFLVGQLRTFFKDLVDEDYESAIALVHSRFSTNTNPSWERAHPNRFIVHNGEINTIKGNADRMLSREETMVSSYLEDEMSKITPVVNTNGSDSAMLDNTLEFFVMNGMPLPLAVMITIPEPWSNNKAMEQEKKDFYQYYATMMEPWDGPAYSFIRSRCTSNR